MCADFKLDFCVHSEHPSLALPRLLLYLRHARFLSSCKARYCGCHVVLILVGNPPAYGVFDGNLVYLMELFYHGIG